MCDFRTQQFNLSARVRTSDDKEVFANVWVPASIQEQEAVVLVDGEGVGEQGVHASHHAKAACKSCQHDSDQAWQLSLYTRMAERSLSYRCLGGNNGHLTRYGY